MPMEQRRPQKLNRKKQTQTRHSTGAPGKMERPDIKLELQTNSWLRIGLAAKDLQKKFNNLFCHFTMENLREAFHALDGSKATGIHGTTKRDYGKELDANLRDLIMRLHRGTYRPLPKKSVTIPKANGKTRPIAISEFEDKLVEWVLAKLLSSIYEPIFIRNSFGFRPRKGAHDAIRASYLSLKDNKRPFVVEIDLESFFDTLSHRRLIKLLEKRITDPRVLSLVSRFLTAGILEQNGDLKISETGTPQGSIMSPVLANVFLHYALDSWFLANYAKQGAIIIRYADDAIFLFEMRYEAETFRSELKSHLNEFGLRLNEDKSGIIHFEKRQAKEVFHFLGFTFFWSIDYRSTRRALRVKTSKTTLIKKIQEYQTWIKDNRGRMKLNELWRLSAAKLRGHYNYYGIVTNRSKLNHFFYTVKANLFKWLNRRSQRRSFTWAQFGKRLTHFPLPPPPLTAALVQLDNRWRFT